MLSQNQFSQKTLRKFLSAVSVTLLAGSSVLTLPTIASASAEGCTSAPSGYVCNNTKGDKARVNSVYAIRSRNGLICNWGVDVSVLAPGGRVKWFRHFDHIGCTPVRAYVKLNVNKTFSCGDETSVRFYESGAPQGGFANVKLSCR